MTQAASEPGSADRLKPTGRGPEGSRLGPLSIAFLVYKMGELELELWCRLGLRSQHLQGGEESWA